MKPSRTLGGALTALLVAAVGGCAAPETRVRDGLVRAGLAPDTAACVADRMVDRLSLTQLARLGDLPKARSEPSLDGFLHRVRGLGDAEVVGVVTSSTALCGTGLAH